MSEISFETLFAGTKESAHFVFLDWTDHFLEGFGIADSVKLPSEYAYDFIGQLQTARRNFPAKGGYEKASPFKKAAYLYVSLHAYRPFLGSLPVDVFNGLAAYTHAPSSIIGFSMVKECLLNAELHRSDNKCVRLQVPITTSFHFFRDLVDASSGIALETHYKTFSMLFEALAYGANPQASYDKVI
ncbi:MAG: hypothetical protein LBK99_06615 [Opitutaceae bacterium]|jgi:hypothetical protein|nr:hypothetical protein [Opitutaceae bacterium]